MGDTATQRIVDAVERAIRQVMKASSTHPKVDIVTDGVRRLVYINGHRINGVLNIELPVKAREIGPQIALHIVADEIVHRTVSTDEFKQMLQGPDAVLRANPIPQPDPERRNSRA